MQNNIYKNILFYGKVDDNNHFAWCYGLKNYKNDSIMYFLHVKKVFTRKSWINNLIKTIKNRKIFKNLHDLITKYKNDTEICFYTSKSHRAITTLKYNGSVFYNNSLYPFGYFCIFVFKFSCIIGTIIGIPIVYILRALRVSYVPLFLLFGGLWSGLSTSTAICGTFVTHNFLSFYDYVKNSIIGLKYRNYSKRNVVTSLNHNNLDELIPTLGNTFSHLNMKTVAKTPFTATLNFYNKESVEVIVLVDTHQSILRYTIYTLNK